METRRVTFNIATYLENLQQVIQDNPEMIDDEVQRYKDFLSRLKGELVFSVISYTTNNETFLTDKRLRSFILPCFVEILNC
jgi:predicted DNA-binding ArsR family transcriptional regulator